MQPEAEQRFVERVRQPCKDNRLMAFLHAAIAVLVFSGFAYFYILIRGVIDSDSLLREDISMGCWIGAAVGFVMMVMVFVGTFELLLALRRFAKGTPTDRLLVKYYDQLKEQEMSCISNGH